MPLCWKQMKSSEVISSEINNIQKFPSFPHERAFVNVLLSLEVGFTWSSETSWRAPFFHSFTKRKSFSACIVVTLPRMLTSATVLRIQSTTDSKSTKLKSGCCLSRCSSAAKVSSWFFRMEPVQQWEVLESKKGCHLEMCRPLPAQWNRKAVQAALSQVWQGPWRPQSTSTKV